MCPFHVNIPQLLEHREGLGNRDLGPLWVEQHASSRCARNHLPIIQAPMAGVSRQWPQPSRISVPSDPLA